jgi:cytochrome c biogenesis protein CcdA
MIVLLFSFLAGILTAAAPCSLPILPIILGSSATEKNLRRSFTVIASLSISIFVFTLLLKTSTLLIMVPVSFWQTVSGSLIALIGLSFLSPSLWERLSLLIGLNRLTAGVSSKAGRSEGILKDVLIGLSLGPIFASCSPTYTYVIATVLPSNFILGILNLLAYVAGLALILTLVALLGNKLTYRLKFMADPHGWFRRVLGVILLVVGVMIVTGLMKQAEAYLLNSPIFIDLINWELDLTKTIRN